MTAKAAKAAKSTTAMVKVNFSIPQDALAEIQGLFLDDKSFSEYCRNVILNELKRVKSVRESKQSNDANSAVIATIEAMMLQNINAKDENEKVFINTTSVQREYPKHGYVKKDGSKSSSVNVALLNQILASKADELDKHHAEIGIDKLHNLRMRRK